MLAALIRRVALVTEEELLGLHKAELYRLCRNLRTLRRFGDHIKMQSQADDAQRHLLARMFNAASTPHGDHVRHALVTSARELRVFMNEGQHSTLSRYARSMATTSSNDGLLERPPSEGERFTGARAGSNWVLLSAACSAISTNDVEVLNATVASAVSAIEPVPVTLENRTALRVALAHILGAVSYVSEHFEERLLGVLREKSVEVIQLICSFSNNPRDIDTCVVDDLASMYSLFVGIVIQLPATAARVCGGKILESNADVDILALFNVAHGLLRSHASAVTFADSLSSSLRRIDNVLRFAVFSLVSQSSLEIIVQIASCQLGEVYDARQAICAEDVCMGGLLRAVAKGVELMNGFGSNPAAAVASDKVIGLLLHSFLEKTGPIPQVHRPSSFAYNSSSMPYGLSLLHYPQDLIYLCVLKGTPHQFSALLEHLQDATVPWWGDLFLQTMRSSSSSNGSSAQPPPSAVSGSIALDRWRFLVARLQKKMVVNPTGMVDHSPLDESETLKELHHRAEQTSNAVVASLVQSLTDAIDSMDAPPQVATGGSAQQTLVGIRSELVEKFLATVSRSHRNSSSLACLANLLHPRRIVTLLRQSQPNNLTALLLVHLIGSCTERESDRRRELLRCIVHETVADSSACLTKMKLVHVTIAVESLAAMCTSSGFEPSMVAMYEHPLRECVTAIRRSNNSKRGKQTYRLEPQHTFFAAGGAHSALSKHFRAKHARICSELLCSLMELVAADIIASPAWLSNLRSEIVRWNISRAAFFFGLAVVVAPPPRSNQGRLHDAILALVRHLDSSGRGERDRSSLDGSLPKVVHYATVMCRTARTAQYLIGHGKQSDKFRGSAREAGAKAGILDASKAIKYLVGYQTFLMGLAAVHTAGRQHDTTPMCVQGLTARETLVVLLLDSTFHILLEHQRKIRLLSSTNMLARKPLMRSVTAEWRELYISCLEKLCAASPPPEEGSGSEVAPFTSTFAPSASRFVGNPDFATNSAIVALELSPHLGLSAEQRERLVAVVIHLTGRLRGTQRARIGEILAKGEVLFA